jgi:hypothetical protein
MLQPRKHDLFACFFDLACKKDFVQDSVDLSSGVSTTAPRILHFDPCIFTHLVEIEHQIQLADIPEELI